jgi:hypothetical protein
VLDLRHLLTIARRMVRHAVLNHPLPGPWNGQGLRHQTSERSQMKDDFDEIIQRARRIVDRAIPPKRKDQVENEPAEEDLEDEP